MLETSATNHLAQMPKRREEVIVKELGDEALLFAPDGKAVHVLNQSAYLIWTLCDGAHSIPAIATVMAEHYDVDRASIVADITQTLASLQDKDLVHPL
jgi:hypothetical protein